MSGAEALAAQLEALRDQPVESHPDLLERLHELIVAELRELDSAKPPRSGCTDHLETRAGGHRPMRVGRLTAPEPRTSTPTHIDQELSIAVAQAPPPER